jgi:hypothetical protein
MEDYCSRCAGSFDEELLEEKGSELLCPDCLAGKEVVDPEVEALKQVLGSRFAWPGAADIAIVAFIAVALGVGWAIGLAPRSIWWSLFLAVAPMSCGAYLRMRCDPDNSGTMAAAIAAGALVPIVGFVAHLIHTGQPLWITLFLIPFGAATGLMSTVGMRR